MIALSMQNEQIIDKYKNDVVFSNKMNRISHKFHQYQQLAVYKELQQNSKVLVSIKSNDEESWSCKRENRINIQIVIGKHQPNGKKSIENLLLSIIKYFPRPTQPYSFLYINTLADKHGYSDFKKIVDFLPLQYLSFLDKVYVLQASFMFKAFDLISFDYILNYFRNKTVYINSLQEVFQKIGLNDSMLLQKLPTQIANQLNQSSSIIQQSKVNSSAIKLLNKNIAVLKTLEEYESGKTGAPLIIELLIYYLNEHKEYLDVEGLFRKSANIQEETLLLRELEKQNYNYLQTINDSHLVPNAIKRFLSNLAQPIIPYQHFNNLMACQDEKLAVYTKKVVNSLPNHRKMTLFLIVEFLKEKIIPRTNYNQMNQENLSIVIGPCVMRSQIASLKDLAYASKIVNVMRIVFKDFEVIFGSKKERMNLIRCSVREQEGQELKQRLGGLQQQYLWLQKAKLTQQEQQNLDEADDFLSAFNKK